MGPTNSGKTHAAMDRLAAGATGAYAAPLRLMAMEACDRLNVERDVPCDLLTGEEHETVAGARHVASTIEMCHLGRRIDVGVIDEVQMLADPDRGWAWTQAVLGLPAGEVVMTGSPAAIPWVRQLTARTGEPLEIEHFARKTPLAPLTAAVARRTSAPATPSSPSPGAR